MYPPTVTRTVLGTALIAMTLAFAAGCGGSDPNPSPPPTPHPSPTATATGKVAPPLPPAAAAHTKAGAIAFVRHYVDLINYAQATGDLMALKAVESAHCESCIDAREGVAAIYKGGGHLVGGDLHLVQVIAVLSQGPKNREVDVAIHFDRQSVVKPDGTKHLKGGKNALSIFLTETNSGWKVSQWTRAN